MLGLEQPNTSYIILSSDSLDQMVSVLYAKEYRILPIKGFYEGNFEDSIMAFGSGDNEELRRDAIFLLNKFGQDCAIVKYLGESDAKKVFRDGSEDPMGIVMYNTESSNKSYIHGGISFSFVEKMRYWMPKGADDLKAGMIVEYMNNNRWHEKIVVNPREEWEKMYRLLLKYEKLRVPAKQEKIYS